MIKPNLNYYNEYHVIIEPTNRSKALDILRKMSDAKPGLMQQAKITINDEIDGSLDIFISNTSAFDESTKRIIFNFLNYIRKIN